MPDVTFMLEAMDVVASSLTTMFTIKGKGEQFEIRIRSL